MRRDELLEIIANGENSGVAFKRDEIRPEQLAVEIVALANLRGGMILLGVEDDGRISGIRRSNLEEWVMDTVVSRKVHPLLIPFYEEVQVDEGIRVAVVSFPPGTAKPYVVRHNDREDIYVRIGSVSRKATREQQARLFAAGGLLRSETLPVAGTSFHSLDFVQIQDYLVNVIRDPDLPDSDSAWIQRLTGMGFLAELPDLPVVCTVAGLVLFGVAPRRFLRQAGIRLMVFAGGDKSSRSLLDTVLDGPLVGRWAVMERGVRELADRGLIERLAESLQPFLRVESMEIDAHFRRPSLWIYPWEAIREACVNALAHRDWTRSTDVEICMYGDRLEVTSPGALQNTMTVAKMIAGQRSPRNPIIVDVLRDYGYVDARGMGVRTKIIPLMRQHNRAEPLFDATDDYLNVVLPQGPAAAPQSLA